MSAQEKSERQKDLAVLPRAQLIRGGFEALAQQKTDVAVFYFGAAIRKAKRVSLWDVEAEFYKFVTLYLQGNYGEAAKRCVECLDSVKLATDAAMGHGVSLPRDAVAERLSECLIQSMVMRRDSFFQLTNHFWQMHLGEYYLLKRHYSLFAAMMKAWFATSNSVSIAYDMLKTELTPFTSFLQSQLDAAKDLVSEEDSEAAGQAAPERRQQHEANPTAQNRESEYFDFLKKSSEATIMRLSEAEIDRVLDICRSTHSIINIAQIAKIIDPLGPNSKKVYLAAMATNDFMKTAETKFDDSSAERLHEEVLEFIEKSDSRQ
jgi:hypothetical protein